jgi:hypothetical protein
MRGNFYILIMIVCLLTQHTGMLYAGGLSEEKRAQVLERLEGLKTKYERGEISWKPGITEFTFMTDEELKQYLGLRGNREARFSQESDDSYDRPRDVYPHVVMPQAGDLPSTFDWRDNSGNWVTPIKKQYGGSCWAFASIAVLETVKMMYGGKSDQTIDLSEAFLCDCSRSDPNYNGHHYKCLRGCDGYYYKENREFVWPLRYLVEEGTVPEECLRSNRLNTCGVKFLFWQGGCEKRCEDWEDKIVRARDYKEIANYYVFPYGEAGDELITAIKRAIVDHGLIFTVIHATDDFIKHYTGDVYEGDCENDHESGNHAVAIIGWEDDTRSWICKNSWGTEWGETADFETYSRGKKDGGYFRMRWESCGISLHPAYLTYGYVDGDVTSIDVSPDRDDAIYATVSREDASDLLYLSLNGGESWKIIRGFYNYNEVLHEESEYWETVKEYYDDGWIRNVISLVGDNLMLLNDTKPIWFNGIISNGRGEWDWMDSDYYEEDGEVKHIILLKMSADPIQFGAKIYGINTGGLWCSEGILWEKISDVGGWDFAVSRWGPIYFVDSPYGGGSIISRRTMITILNKSVIIPIPHQLRCAPQISSGVLLVSKEDGV